MNRTNNNQQRNNSDRSPTNRDSFAALQYNQHASQQTHMSQQAVLRLPTLNHQQYMHPAQQFNASTTSQSNIRLGSSQQIMSNLQYHPSQQSTLSIATQNQMLSQQHHNNTNQTQTPFHQNKQQQTVLWSEPKITDRFIIKSWNQSTAIKRHFAFNHCNELLSILSNKGDTNTKYIQIPIEKNKLNNLTKFHKDKIGLYGFSMSHFKLYFKKKHVVFDHVNDEMYDEYYNNYGVYDFDEPSQEIDVGSLWRSITAYLTRAKPKAQNENIKIIKIQKDKYNDIIQRLVSFKLALCFALEKFGGINFDTIQIVKEYENNKWYQYYQPRPYLSLVDLDYRTNIINIKFPLIVFEKYLPSYFDERFTISLISILHYISEIILKRLFIACDGIKKYNDNITFKDLQSVIGKDSILRELFKYFLDNYTNKTPSYLDVCEAMDVYGAFKYKISSFKIDKTKYNDSENTNNKTNKVNICTVLYPDLINYIMKFINHSDTMSFMICCKFLYNISQNLNRSLFIKYVHSKALLNGLYFIWNDINGSVFRLSRIEYNVLSVINVLIVNLLNNIIDFITNNMNNNINIYQLLHFVLKQIFFNNNTILTNIQNVINENLKDFDHGLKFAEWIKLPKNDLIKISNQMIELRINNKHKLSFCKMC